MKFINEIFIERPLHEVFLFTGDPGNIPLWNYAVTDMKKITKGYITEGTTYQQRRNFMNSILEDTFVVTSYKVDELLIIKSIEAEYPFVIGYAFASSANGTIINNTFELHGALADNLPGVLFKNKVKTAVANNLAKLKELLEGMPVPSPV